MTYDPKRRHRRSIRLKGYDYTQPGAYFVTICTHNREPLFGRMVDGDMVLNVFGEMVWAWWREIPDHFLHVELDAFVAMPNHVHGIIWIVGHHVRARYAKNVGATHARAKNVGARHAVPLQNGETIPRYEQFCKPVPGSIPTIIRSFKSAVTRRINEMRDTPGARVWQRNYYEHIIRNDRALNAIRHYITENPLSWHLDRYNPDRRGTDPLAHEIWNMIQIPFVGAQRRCAPTNGQNGGEGHE